MQYSRENNLYIAFYKQIMEEHKLNDKEKEQI